jgi:hypothetical protein
MVLVVGSVPRGKHVLGKVVDAVTHAVLGIKECLYLPPRALDHYLIRSFIHSFI